MGSKEYQELAKEKGIAAAISLEILTMLGEKPHEVKCPECGQEQFSGQYSMAVCGNCGVDYQTGLVDEAGTED
jgi:Zn finger protein HypA/HybF involved in hydrogenase expression